ncbi:Uncharacterised protein (plasmid) [Tsukamurella tyrosinosolvens]|uniref:Uncharacterized protein n=1 Tax=Tsukamurella tyrosinosolvens TaxID=57704 RepID=A0A1H4UMC8_TSUTY|nr:hypothetical protein [Tsukamurella tyrosinosolvens]SEC69264.1 hypothetical protein SAMN04489793_2936 [Tsukamurella tyrosinosolvens]VEH94314.1 Uncharacterised protein [Tsukamurella tyrosinosolvens]
MSTLPPELNGEVDRILARARDAGLVLSRDGIVFSPPDWLTIDGMDPDEWVDAMAMD